MANGNGGANGMWKAAALVLGGGALGTASVQLAGLTQDRADSRYVQKNVYDKDIEYIKESLSDIKRTLEGKR